MDEFKSKFDVGKQLKHIQDELVNERNKALQLQNILHNYTKKDIIELLESTNNKLEQELSIAIQSKLQLCSSTSLEIMRLRQNICSLTNELQVQHGKIPPIKIIKYRPINKNQIRVDTIKKGDCITYPRAFSFVEIKYIGWKYEKNKWIRFTSSATEITTWETRLGNHENIFGLEQAILSMSKNEITNVFVPSRLGYGIHGAPPLILPHQNLKFQLSLIDIYNVQKGLLDITQTRINSLKDRQVLISGYVNKNFDGFIPVDIIKLFLIFHCSNDLNIFRAELCENITFKANDNAFTAKLFVDRDLYNDLKLTISVDEIVSVDELVIVQYEINCDKIGLYECGYSRIYSCAGLLKSSEHISDMLIDEEEELEFSIRFAVSLHKITEYGSDVYHIFPKSKIDSNYNDNDLYVKYNMYVMNIKCDWILCKYMLPDGLLKGKFFFGQNCFCLQCENINDGEILEVYLKLMIATNYYDRVIIECTLISRNNNTEKAVVNELQHNRKGTFHLIDILDATSYSLHVKVMFGNNISAFQIL
eukprot:328370_1